MSWINHKKAAISIAAAVLAVSCGGTENQKSGHDRAMHNKVTITTVPSDQVRLAEPTALGAISNKRRFAGSVAAHNKVRVAHGLNPLRWSDSLAGYAQEWANHLAYTNNCNMRHRPQTEGRFKQQHGENLWWASPRVWSDGITEVQNISIARVVKDWADEKPFYNYRANTCKAGEQCGHYTQIVWRETTEVGCAYQQCTDKSQLWVCNYNPPGNYIGERPY